MPFHRPRHECWTRLAQAYVLMGEKDKACTLLTDAAETEPDVWEIWRDLLTISTYCGNYGKAVRAYLRILELNQPYLNMEALDQIIYSSFEKGAETCSTNEGFDYDLRARLIKVFETLTVLFPKYPPVWCSYGVTIASHENPDSRIRQMTVDILFNAVKSLIEERNWFIRKTRVGYVMKSGKHVALAYKTCSDKFPGTPEGQKLLVIAKDFLTNLLEKVDAHQKNIITGSVLEMFQNDYNEVRKIVDLINVQLGNKSKD